MSVVIKPEITNWQSDIELIFTDSGIRPGKEYKVIVEARGCDDISKRTPSISVKTVGTIKPEFALVNVV